MPSWMIYHTQLSRFPVPSRMIYHTQFAGMALLKHSKHHLYSCIECNPLYAAHKPNIPKLCNLKPFCLQYSKLIYELESLVTSMKKCRYMICGIFIPQFGSPYYVYLPNVTQTSMLVLESCFSASPCHSETFSRANICGVLSCHYIGYIYTLRDVLCWNFLVLISRY